SPPAGPRLAAGCAPVDNTAHYVALRRRLPMVPGRLLSTRYRHRTLIGMAGAAAAAPALAACGKRTPTRAPGASTQKPVALGPDQTYNCTPGQEPWRTAGPPRRGGTLVKATLDWASLDPTVPGG